MPSLVFYAFESFYIYMSLLRQSLRQNGQVYGKKLFSGVIALGGT
jgi:hypothetical protein